MLCCPPGCSAGSATKKWTTTGRRSPTPVKTAAPPCPGRAHIPIDGEPADVVAVINDYSSWLAESDIPKLFINAEPGFIVRGPIRELIRTWPNLTETTVNGIQYVQEDSPDEIGMAIAGFVRKNFSFPSRQSIPVTE
jgi:haloalkane dehalogenase